MLVPASIAAVSAASDQFTGCPAGTVACNDAPPGTGTEIRVLLTLIGPTALAGARCTIGAPEGIRAAAPSARPTAALPAARCRASTAAGPIAWPETGRRDGPGGIADGPDGRRGAGRTGGTGRRFCRLAAGLEGRHRGSPLCCPRA